MPMITRVSWTCAALFCVLLPASVHAQQLNATSKVAQVGGTSITAKQFNARFSALEMQLGASIPASLLDTYKESIIDQLVEEAIITRVVTRTKTRIKPEKLAETVDAQMKQFRAQYKSQEAFQQSISSRFGSVEALRARMERAARRSALLSSNKRTKVAESEAKSFYASHKEHYTIPAEVRARHILLRVKKGQDNSLTIKTFLRAQKLNKQARAKGSDFSSMAQKYSEGPSKTKGGDLGYFKRENMVKPFSDAAFELNAGEISDKPVRSQFGYHIIKVEGFKEARLRPYKEVRASILDGLRASKRRRVWASMRRKALKQLTVKRFPQAVQVRTTKAP